MFGASIVVSPEHSNMRCHLRAGRRQIQLQKVWPLLLITEFDHGYDGTLYQFTPAVHGEVCVCNKRSNVILLLRSSGHTIAP